MAASSQEQHTDQMIQQLRDCSFFAELLTYFLDKCEVKQIELARLLYVEAAAVHNWRTNKRLPDFPMAYRIAHGLGLKSHQTELLIDGWQVTRMARELIPCVEDAIQDQSDQLATRLEKDFARRLAKIQSRFEAEQRWAALVSKRDADDEETWDPEIWLYTP